MTTTSLRTPFGTLSISALYAADELPNIGRRSSRWQVLDAFLRQNEAMAIRVTEGSSGLLIMSGIPGRHDTGAFYIYDEITRSFFSLYFDGKDTFNASEFDYTVAFYDLQRFVDVPKLQLVNKPSTPADRKNVQDAMTTPLSSKQRRNRNWNHRSRKSQEQRRNLHLVHTQTPQPVAVMG